MGLLQRSLALFAVVSLLSACGQDESQRLNDWFAVQYESELQYSPSNMTRLGRKDKYDEFDDFSEAAETAKLQRQADSIAYLKANFDYDKLNTATKVSYDIWLYEYESAKAIAPFSRHDYVFTQMMGAHAGLPNFLINFHKVDNKEDAQAYILRIAALANGLKQLLERAQVAAKEGIRPPRFAYEGVLDQSRKLIKGLPFNKNAKSDAPLWADIQTKVAKLLEDKKINKATAKTLNENARLALLKHFQPAYTLLIAWMEQDIKNTSASAQGASDLPNGKAFYNAKLINRTTTNMSSDEIHALGLKEVARLRGEMLALKDKAEFKGSLQEFFDFIKSNKQFFYDNTDAGRQGYLDDSTAYLDYINSKLPEYFGILPKAGLVVKRVEAFREQDGAAQHYFAGTPDGSRDGVYYAHLSDMASMPKTEMEAIAYHEGNPGHHMQISIAQELTGVPKFRTQIFFNSYVEGWALYSELLAKEMGAYENIYSDFGRLVTEIWRAIRLVVDTGIHAKGWSEAQAVAYFKENTPIVDAQIRSEVRRYFVWPGQATTYKIGMLKILELRSHAKEVLGDKFDIRGFHDTVLGGGALPLPVLESVVESWINEQKES